jgi:hypothetical protein
VVSFNEHPPPRAVAGSDSCSNVTRGQEPCAFVNVRVSRALEDIRERDCDESDHELHMPAYTTDEASITE